MKNIFLDSYGDVREGWVNCFALLTIILVIVAFIGGLIFLANLATSKQCYKTYSEYNPQYSFWSQCRIEWQGKLTPVEMIKNINL